MSLINQMLKDLEHRRSSEQPGISMIPGTQRYTVVRQQRSPWLILFFMTILLLAALVGYLLWERYKVFSWVKLEQPQSLATGQPVSEPPVKQAAQAEMPVVEKQNPPQPSRQRGQVEEQKPPVEQAVQPRKAQQQSFSVATTAQDEEAETAVSTSVPVKKVTRPLNPQQQGEVLYQKGYRLLAAGKSLPGEAALREALSIFPGHIKAREVLAGVYIKAGRVIEASDLLQAGLVVAPEHALFAQLQARILLDQNKTKQAIQVLQQHAPAVTRVPEYHALLAAAYQRDKQHARAVEVYRSLLKVNPGSGVWWIGMGISLEATGQRAQALEAYQRARQTGQLAADLANFTNHRLAALRESGVPSPQDN